MPMCSVIGCGVRKSPNQPSLTIHRIPRNERKKKEWQEAIGMENIRQNVKDVYICSLHFDDKCFNKTLDVTRLRDDAVPLKYVGPCEEANITVNSAAQGTLKVKTPKLHLKTEPALRPAPISGTTGVTSARGKKAEVTVISAAHGTLDVEIPKLPLKTEPALKPVPISGISVAATSVPCKKASVTVTTAAHGTLEVEVPILPLKTDSASKPAPISGTSEAATSALPIKTTAADTAPAPDTSGMSIPAYHGFKMKKLQDKCVSLRKKIRILHQQVRRQKKKIEDCQTIIKCLKAKSKKRTYIVIRKIGKSVEQVNH